MRTPGAASPAERRRPVARRLSRRVPTQHPLRVCDRVGHGGVALAPPRGPARGPGGPAAPGRGRYRPRACSALTIAGRAGHRYLLKSCFWLPLQTVLPAPVEMVSSTGYRSRQTPFTCASGNSSRIICSAARYSWRPPSQFLRAPRPAGGQARVGSPTPPPLPDAGPPGAVVSVALDQSIEPPRDGRHVGPHRRWCVQGSGSSGGCHPPPTRPSHGPRPPGPGGGGGWQRARARAGASSPTAPRP